MKAYWLAFLAIFTFALPALAEDESPAAAPVDPNMPAAETQPPAPSEAPVQHKHRKKKHAKKKGSKHRKAKGKKHKKKHHRSEY